MVLLTNVRRLHISVTTSDKLLSVLRLFTLEAPEWAVAQAAQALEVPVSTTYRFFKSLANAGLISAFNNGTYILGPSISRLDRQLRLTDPLLQAARSELERIADEFQGQLVSFVCRLFKTEVICVHQECGDASLAIGYERGRAMPLYRGSASKIILAHLPMRQLRSLYLDASDEFASADLGYSWAEAKVKLQAIRSAGHCVDKGEVEAGMRGVSVPLFSREHKVIGSLNVAGRRRSIPDHSTERIVHALGAAALYIEKQLARQGLVKS